MNIKKSKKRKKQSPKNYRFIPGPIKKRLSKLNRKRVFSIYTKALKIFTLCILIVAVIAIGVDLNKNLQDKEKIDFEREKITRELDFWQSFVTKHQDYRDAYLQLAILEYRVRDYSKAKFYLNRALSIDPNFEKAKEMERVLSVK